MAGYNNFQVDRNKYTTGVKDIYKKTVGVNKTTENLSKNMRLKEGFKKWTSFYRANPHRFASEYLGLKLHIFQQIIIYMSFHVDFFMYLASRGQGKSWIIAAICCIRCILFPGTKIILASGTKNQARLIITQKIDKDLRLNYPNLAREIKDIKTGQNECSVLFQNNSTIEAVTSNDGARGFRGNILILDEFRLIKEDILKKVLRPFLNVNRQPPYLSNPKYQHLQEENKEIYISSAWYKNHWIWEKLKAFKTSMINGKSYFACAFPYQLSLFHGLLSKKRVEQMKTEDDFDPITWMMEMDCLFFGESENAFFKLDDIQKCRTIIKPFYPSDNIDFLSKAKKGSFKYPKQEGEIRIIGVDVALMQGDDNDSTIFTCMRLLPNGTVYQKQVPYIESIHGQHTEIQAIRLKRLFYDFEADYVAMDTHGNGVSLYDDCTKILYDQDRDIEYPGWCAMNNEEMKNRALDKNALPIIFSIKVVKAELNHDIAMYLKTCLEKRTIKFLINDIEGKEFLIEKHDFLKKTPEDQVKLLKPYLQTSMMVNELVNLEYEVKSGFVKVREVGRNSKDRYSSLAYANYFARTLEAKLRKKTEKTDISKFFLFKQPTIRKL